MLVGRCSSELSGRNFFEQVMRMGYLGTTTQDSRNRSGWLGASLSCLDGPSEGETEIQTPLPKPLWQNRVSQAAGRDLEGTH